MPGENGQSADTDSAPTRESLYSVLSDKRRRYTLHYLKQRGDQVGVRDLAEQVAAWENDKPIEELTSQERKRVYIALYQSHLSTLDEKGLVEYNEDEGTVSVSDSMRSMDLYLEVVPSESIPWSLFYVGLAVANAIILGLAWFEVRPFSTLPDLGWAVVVLLSFGISAVLQIYYARRRKIGDEGPPPELDS